MRLIDADTLIDAIRHDVDQTPDSDWGYGLNHAIPIVRSQPTVDAVKEAHWEKRTGMMPPEYHGHYWCSNCEWHGRYNERERDYKFCPACGAKMTINAE